MTYKMRRYFTLCSWHLGIWSFQTIVKKQGSGDVYEYVYLYVPCASIGLIYI